MKKYHHCVKFTYPLSFQTRIPKVDQHTGGKWLIHGTKHRKDNQLQSLELLVYCTLLQNLGWKFMVLFETKKSGLPFQTITECRPSKFDCNELCSLIM